MNVIGLKDCDDESGEDKIFLKLERNVGNEMKYARHQASVT